ncbi:DUF4261 domain-containing protein [Neisseriaceae bacterium B1]
MIWVYIGIGKNQQGNQLYTVGMQKFGKNEEILNSQTAVNTLHATLLSICSYIISANITIQHGETLSFRADQKWAISRTKSVHAPSEDSLKIAIP